MAIKMFSRHYLSLLYQLSDDFNSTDYKPAIDKYQRNKTNILHALTANTEPDDLDKYYELCVFTNSAKFLAKVMSMDEFMLSNTKFLKFVQALPGSMLDSERLVSEELRKEYASYVSWKKQCEKLEDRLLMLTRHIHGKLCFFNRPDELPLKNIAF